MNAPAAGASVLVEYVGLKPEETDHLYGTGIVWRGAGDVHEVPAKNWALMKKHVDVWREVTAAASPLAAAPSPAPAPAPTPAPAPSAPVALEAMTRDELYALAVGRELKPHAQLGKAKLLELLKAKG